MQTAKKFSNKTIAKEVFDLADELYKEAVERQWQ
jgi:hypothetical protein